MSKWVHKLSNINPRTRTARCANCGTVSLTKKHNGWRCSTAEKKWWNSGTRRLRRLYNLSPEKREQLLASQGGVCAICKKPGKLVVDHCHASGCVRGLLHSTCNAALGMFRDNVEHLQNAIAYLKKEKVH